MTGVVLSGGTSSRMGSPKHALMFGGETLLARAINRLAPVVERTLIVGSGLEVIEGVHHVSDILHGLGPLGGIHAALTASRSECLVVACDMPFFSVQLLLYMSACAPEADAVVPFVNGFWEPLHAVYRPSCLPHIDRIAEASTLRQRQPRVADLYSRINVRSVSEEEVLRFGVPNDLFFNMNSPADYERAIKMCSQQDSLGPS